MNLVREDPRIGPSHISLYLAILAFCHQHGSKVPLTVFRRDLIKQAKIGDRTYYSCISDLEKFGLIRYEPSNNPACGSLIYIMVGRVQSQYANSLNR